VEVLIRNILKNAAKHADRAGQVVVSLRLVKDTPVLTVFNTHRPTVGPTTPDLMELLGENLGKARMSRPGAVG
jgi:signal transduction histidine kinase